VASAQRQACARTGHTCGNWQQYAADASVHAQAPCLRHTARMRGATAVVHRVIERATMARGVWLRKAFL
jgi:hypothetical protein